MRSTNRRFGPCWAKMAPDSGDGSPCARAFLSSLPIWNNVSGTKPGRIDDQGIPFPVADRFSEIGRIGALAVLRARRCG